MPTNNISHARRTQGRFANRLSDHLPVAAESHRPRVHPLAQAVRISNAHSLVYAALLLSAAVPRRGIAPLPVPGRERPGGPPRFSLALLHGAQAMPVAAQPPEHDMEMLDRLIPVRPALAGRPSGIDHAAAALTSIGNAALGTCVMAPRRCPQALLASSVAVTATLVGAAADTAFELLQPARHGAGPAASLSQQADHMLHALPPADRRAMLKILRDCGSEPACTARIRERMLSLPAPVQHAMENALADSAISTVAPAASVGWPPATQAIAPAAPHGWVEAAISLLESVYDSRSAAYMLDLEEIAQVTQDAQVGQPRGMREVVANQQRGATIEALFKATGHPVDRVPFNISAHDLRGVPRTAWGSNLLLTFAGAGAPAHTLLLVAHGDMTGTDTRSSGALDNGTGVATLLALTRELQDTDLPRGTRVQLLVTDQGERGMMGAKAHVQRCLAQRSCPDAVLNLDMLGAGDGLAISGSDQRHLFIMDTQRTDQRQPGRVNAREAHLRRLLEQAATDVGVARHPRREWTQISDHLPFQREGIPALGLTLITRADQDAEANLQATYAELLRRHAAVDWPRMDDYLNGRMARAESEAMRDRLAEHAAVSTRYRRLSDSAYRPRTHNGFDQVEQVQSRAAMDTLNVVRRTVHAWLHDPGPAVPRS